MSAPTDRVIEHLRGVADLPDLSGTKYRLVRSLGRGGMGSVYEVRDAELDREVALKVLSVADPDGRFAARLLNEARLLARLEHPNIVPVHDVGSLPDGRVFCVMKLVRGQRLDAWRRGGPPRTVALRLFQKICQAVAFAHARGVVHRDLKPENVMVGAFGEALVMDWGVAKGSVGPAATDDVTVGEGTVDGAKADGETTGEGAAAPGTAAGAVIGTPAYMAPEQARGETELVGPRSDVYALGGILYFLLAGRAPFEADDWRRPTAHAAGEGPPALRDIVPGMPRPLESICARAMARDPGERYATAEALAEDIERYLERLSVSAHRESMVERGARLLDRNRVLAYLVLAYLAMRLLVLFVARR